MPEARLKVHTQTTVKALKISSRDIFTFIAYSFLAL
jgi:hypothetical protein